MRPNDLIQALAYLLVLITTIPLLGGYMARAFSGERHVLSPVLAPVERAVYLAGGIDPSAEMRWTSYLAALLVFNGLGFLAILVLQLAQSILPLNPAHLPDVRWDLAF